MHKLVASAFGILISLSPCAQQYAENPYPRTITVSGSAELEIVPDLITVQITLKEYQKKGDYKKNLADIKNDFLARCRETGIPDSVVSIAGYHGDNDYFAMRRNRKKGDELFASVTYQVVFRSSTQMDALVDKLDDLATASFTISSTGHSDMVNIRKQIKTLAIKAAREKARYLAEAIYEKIGNAVTVNESAIPDQYPYYSSTYSNNAIIVAPDSDAIDFRKMKIRHEVMVTFALK